MAVYEELNPAYKSQERQPEAELSPKRGLGKPLQIRSQITLCLGAKAHLPIIHTFVSSRLFLKKKKIFFL